MALSKPLNNGSAVHARPTAFERAIASPPAVRKHAVQGLLSALLATAVGGGAYLAIPNSHPNEAFASQLLTELPAEYLQNARSSLSHASATVLVLQEHIADFLIAPDSERLTAARNAWRLARNAWQHAEVFNLIAQPEQPLAGDPLRSWAVNRIDPWPVEADFVHRIIGSSSGKDSSLYALTQSNLVALNDDENAASSIIGFHAVEWLLWFDIDELEANPTAVARSPYSAQAAASVLKAYDPNTPSNHRRRRYLRLVAEQLSADVSHLNNAWNDGGEGYAARIESAPAKQALATILEGLVLLLEQEMLRRSLTVPLGTANPALSQSPYSRNSLNDLAANLSGIEDVVLGTNDSNGLIQWLNLQDPEAADRLKRELKFAAGSLRQISGSLHATITKESAQSDRLIVNSLIKALESVAQSIRQVSSSMKLELPGRDHWEASG